MGHFETIRRPVVEVDVPPFTAAQANRKKRPDHAVVVEVVVVTGNRSPKVTRLLKWFIEEPTPQLHDFIRYRLLSVAVEFHVWHARRLPAL